MANSGIGGVLAFGALAFGGYWLYKKSKATPAAAGTPAAANPNAQAQSIIQQIASALKSSGSAAKPSGGGASGGSSGGVGAQTRTSNTSGGIGAPSDPGFFDFGRLLGKADTLFAPDTFAVPDTSTTPTDSGGIVGSVSDYFGSSSTPGDVTTNAIRDIAGNFTSGGAPQGPGGASDDWLFGDTFAGVGGGSTDVALEDLSSYGL